MRVYAPSIKVRLIKSSARTELAPGVPVAKRFADLTEINLTPFLGESGTVTTTKGVRNPSGTFSITFADQAHPRLLDTVYALIEPMDMVEIRFGNKPGEHNNPPVVMRGLVSSIMRNEIMTGEKPIRTITVGGKDFGMILEINMLYYINNSIVGDNFLTEFQFFQKYKSFGEPRNLPANDFVKLVASSIIGKYLERFNQFNNGRKLSAKTVSKWVADTSISGVVSPWSIAQHDNVSLYSMLHDVLDIGPFNEMYVEDRPDSIALVVRKNPYMDIAGTPVQGVKPVNVNVDSLDMVALNVTRTDAGVANFFWVVSNAWTMMLNEQAKSASSVGAASTFIKFNYLNSEAGRFGIRKMEVQTNLLPADGFTTSDSQSSTQIDNSVGAVDAWISDRRRILSEQNKDNSVFEHGSIRLRGNTDIKAGVQITLTRGKAVTATYYVSEVTHEFSALKSFITTATLERGTSYKAHLQSDHPVYRLEMEAGGVK